MPSSTTHTTPEPRHEDGKLVFILKMFNYALSKKSLPI